MELIWIQFLYNGYMAASSIRGATYHNSFKRDRQKRRPLSYIVEGAENSDENRRQTFGVPNCPVFSDLGL